MKTSSESSAGLQGPQECEITAGSKEDLQAAGGKSAAALDEDKGNASDDSVRIVESDLLVIAIDDSENEEEISNVPVVEAIPQKSVSADPSSSGIKTNQLNDVCR